MTNEYSGLDRILSRYFDGSIGAEELAELEAKLNADDQFAAYASRWCLLHRQIAELLTETQLHELMDDFIKGSPTFPRDTLLQLTPAATRAGSKSQSGVLSRMRRIAVDWQPSRRFMIGAVIAASTLVFLASRMHFQDGPRNAASPGTDQDVNSQRAADASQEVVATLTQVEDCVWQADAPVLHHGQQLMKGNRIALRSGMAKVTFDCG